MVAIPRTIRYTKISFFLKNSPGPILEENDALC